MSKTIKIESYGNGQAANLYVVRFEDQSESEMDAFFQREKGVTCNKKEKRRCLDIGKGCKKGCRREEYLERLYELISLSTAEKGFRPEFFRPFDHYRFPTCSLQAGSYRLYGMRFDADLFVAGGGGIKFVRRVDDDPILHGAFRDVKDAAQRLRKRMQRRGMDHPPRDDRGLLYLPESLIEQPFPP